MKRRAFLKLVGLAPAAPVVMKMPAVQAVASEAVVGGAVAVAADCGLMVSGVAGVSFAEWNERNLVAVAKLRG